MKKCGLLQEAEGSVLAGKIGAMLDVVTQMPAHIWYEEHSQAHDQGFSPWVLSVVSAGCLLLLDAGLLNFNVVKRLLRLAYFYTGSIKGMSVAESCWPGL